MRTRTRVPRACLVAILLYTSVAVAPFVAPREAAADDNTTFCKWGFPWPREIYFWVNDWHFDAGQANAIQYGGESWWGANANLWFVRDYGAGYNGEVRRGPVQAGHIAETGTTTIDCNVDAGRPITWAYTVYDQAGRFYADCLAIGQQWCRDNQYYDVHNVSTHEFGHWVWLNHTGDTGASMHCCIGWGDVNKRDINWHDGQSVRIMYGSR